MGTKCIYLNLKRFDVPTALGGVNQIAAPMQWAQVVMHGVEASMADFPEARCTVFLPEAHLIPALAVRKNVAINVGCQGVYREDITREGNFGAYTTNRPAAAMRALGVNATMIGHCEERMDKLGIMHAGGVYRKDSVDQILNAEVRTAQKQGMDVLFCIGETLEEKPDRWNVLRKQIEIGLKLASRKQLTVAYEPVWAIGPGKIPPTGQEIGEIAHYIKRITQGLPLVYGGGLKIDNAKELASIPDVDGGLIALTRFRGDIGYYPEEFAEIVRLYLTA